MIRTLIARFVRGRFSAAAAIVIATAGVVDAQILFTENFDGLAGSLGTSVNERVGLTRVTRRVADAGASVPWAGPTNWASPLKRSQS